VKTIKNAIAQIFYTLAVVCSSILKGGKTFLDDLNKKSSTMLSELIHWLIIILILIPMLWLVLTLFISKTIAEILFDKDDRPDFSNFIF
jgi:high-affinity K+ transport system ATPase subunit B